MWWAVVGTDLTGAAVVMTSDAGVFLERISYLARRSAPDLEYLSQP
jgi:hypothetical protein